MGFAEEKELDAKYLIGNYARKQVEFVSGKGMYLYDDQGKQYLDMLSGIGVCCLGHCPDVLVNAMNEQASKLIHVSNYYYIEHRGAVAKTLSEMLSEGQAEPEVWKTFFANSGAEANECAIKLARLTARKRVAAAGGDIETAPRTIVVIDKSFHGRTLATLAATAQPAKQEAFQPLPGGFVSTPINDVEALKQLFAANSGQICAVMLEVVQGESGVNPCSQEFLTAVRQLTQENDALMICDEVQCGIYRTGKPFAFQHFGIDPDIVTMAKGIAGGFPMGACAARAGVADTFDPGDHGSTFGGSNLAVAAADAVLTALRNSDIPASVEEVGAYLRQQLATLPQVKEVRGLGLMCAVQFNDDMALSATDIVAQGLEAGLVLNYTGPHTLRFLPPLVCQKSDVDQMIAKLSAICA